MTDLALFLGRFHPFLVHLPIGFLLLAGALELLARRPAFAGVRPVTGPVLLMSAAAAVLSAGAGYLLASSGAYDGGTLAWHRALGLAVAATTVLAAAAWYRSDGGVRRPVRRAYEGLLVVSVVLVAIAGHLGGTLTHGEGYLTEHAPAFLRLTAGSTATPAARAAHEIVVYRELVQPLMASRCVDCHGPDRREGGLRLDGPDEIRKGGESGAAITAGSPDGSELLRRLWLPRTDPEAMPPKGRAPLSVAEAGVLRWWIAQGASFEQTLADAEIPDHLRPAVEAIVGPVESGRPAILAVATPAADPAKLEQARRLGVSVSPLADDTSWLSAHCTNAGREFGDAELDALAGLGAQITWLDLTGTSVTDTGLAALSRFPNLTRLQLDRTGIGDAGLAHLAGLDRLEYLNLYGTRVTDEGLSHLTGLENLRSLYLWQTGASAQGVDRLRAGNPRLEIDLGLAPSESLPSPPRS